MKCPKCGLARPLDDRLCRRCKYVFDEDRFVSLTPPRASDRTMLQRVVNLERFRRPFECLQGIRTAPWVPVLASLVPGLGHALLGRPWKGIFYLVLVALIGGLSVHFFSGTYGQMLFGLAVSAHASCVLDASPWGRSPRATPRILAMAAILTGLLFLYWPLLQTLANLFVSPERRQGDTDGGPPIQALGGEQIAVMAILFAASTAISTWVSRRLSSGES